MQLGDRFGNATDGGEELLPDSRILGTNRPLQPGQSCDDVWGSPRVELSHGHDRRTGRIDLARDDRLQRHDHETPDHDGVDAFVGAGSVRALPDNLNREIIRRRIDGALGHDDGPRMIVAVEMAAEYHARAFQRPCFDHGQRAGAFFLCRLKNQSHGSRQVFLLGEKRRRAEQHGGVPIVAAGVHDTVMDRREIQAGVFLNRQRVRIGTQDDAGDSSAPWNVGDDSVAGNVSPILDGQPIEKFADHGSGVGFLPTEFRILVEHAAKLNETML